jgi:phospholipid transport system substrate-binding protein
MTKALIILVVLTSLSSLSFAQQPIEALQKSIDQSIDILTDTNYQDRSQKDVQRQRLWQELIQIFDFQEFSKRILARYWRKFTPRQREDFVELLGNFVNIYYLSRLQERYNNEKVTLMGQNMISRTKAVVQANVRWQNKDVPLEIKMLKRGDSWKVYDITALGISAVGLYRGQFQAILRKESPEHVIEMLKEKIKKAEEKIRQK